MGSSRFPGKMLAELGEFTIIDWVIQRMKRSKNIQQIVLATSVQKHNDVLDEVAYKHGISVFRGSEDDVLNRFSEAAKYYQADIVVRICADNPFVAPEEIDRLVNFFMTHPCDYACNHQELLGNGYADGFGGEIFNANLLKALDQIKMKPDDREHVTLYLLKHPDQYSILSVPAPKGLNFPELKYDVDTIEDLLNLKNLVNNGITIESDAVNIVKLSHLLKNEPSSTY